jgi:DNA-3-methyladenine glycosylase
MRIDENFFERKSDIVARELLGKILIRKIDGKILRAKIVETESYFGEEDPASRASKGKNKISEMMWESPGKILIYNVHKYKMLNFVTDKKGVPSAVLIRAVEPLNFNSKCSGPGLLTNSLKIDNEFHGENIIDLKNLELKNNEDKIEIVEKFRIGVTKDLDIPLRFYIKGNEFVSKK